MLIQALFVLVPFFLISCFDSKFLPEGKVSAPPASGIEHHHNQTPCWSFCSPIQSLEGLAGGFQHLEQLQHKMDLKLDTIWYRCQITRSLLSPEVCTVSDVCTTLYCHRGFCSDVVWSGKIPRAGDNDVPDLLAGRVPSPAAHGWRGSAALPRAWPQPHGWQRGQLLPTILQKTSSLNFTFSLVPWFLGVK